MSLLYDFKQQHPEADIDPFLRKSSQFFQDYIEKGLQSIDNDRRRLAAEQGMQSSIAAPLTAASSMSSLGMIFKIISLKIKTENFYQNMKRSPDERDINNTNVKRKPGKLK